jgi:hypothetical protein
VLRKGKQSAHDSGMTFCTFIRYAQSQIIKKKKKFTARKPNDLHMITKVQKIQVCFKEEISLYMSTFMSRADITFKDKKSIVVKELRSKMFGQHPGYFQAVFLMQTRIIIVSIYKYTVYIMF